MTHDHETPRYTAFRGSELLAQGQLNEILTRTKQCLRGDDHHGVLIFNDQTGRTFDLDLSGSLEDVMHRARVFLPVASTPVERKPGRPKLGVVTREVSLLPRHWEWLETQEGGASATLRRLVEQGSKAGLARSQQRQAQDRTYQFLTVMAGDLPGYEEALRALYKNDLNGMAASMGEWPKDVRTHALALLEA